MGEQNSEIGEETVAEGDEASEGTAGQDTVDPYGELTLEDAIALVKQKDQVLVEKQTQLQQKEEFIQSQRSKIGQAKEFQQKYEEASIELQKAQTKLDQLKDDPSVDMDQYADAKLEANRHQTARDIASMTLAEFQVAAAVPEFDELLKTDIPTVMKAEGYSDYQIQQFQANWKRDPVFATSLANRAKLHKENVSLKQQLEQGKRKKVSEGEQVAKASALSSGINISGTPTGHVKAVENMTEAEIVAEYNKLMKKGVVTLRKEK